MSPRNPDWEADDLAENIKRFGPSQYVARLRERMTVRGEEGMVTGENPGRALLRPHETPHPPEHPHPDHGMLCECYGCEEWVKARMRELNILPHGDPDRASYTVEPITGRLKVPPRYRKDESDR